MATTLEFFTGLFILLAGSVLAGELSLRFGQVALVGQVAVGILVGPAFVGGLLDGVFHLNLTPISLSLPWVYPVEQIALFFILFLAGLELSPTDLWRAGPQAIGLGVVGFLVPFVSLVALTPLLFPSLSPVVRLFIALVLSVEALPVITVLLAELNLTTTRLASLVVGSSVVTMFIVMSAFGILIATYAQNPTLAGGLPPMDIARSVLQLGAFIGIIFGLHFLLKKVPVVRTWTQRLVQRWRTREVNFALLMIVALAGGLLSQTLGLTLLPGVFFVGLLLTSESAGLLFHRQVNRILSSICWGFFIPLFFVITGLSLDLQGALTLIVPLLLLLVVATTAKVGTGTFVTRLFGWSASDAGTIGFVMNARGAVELALASILYVSGVFTITLYTLVAVVGILATVIAPIGANWVRRGTPGPVYREEMREYQYPGLGGEPPPLPTTISAPAETPPSPPS
jgi:Kef-type K+ transport system membrane component KefB